MNGIQSITIIGAGCVGSFFARELFKRGYRINQIVSRTPESAVKIAHELNAEAFCGPLTDMPGDADLYILSVKDEVIMEMRKEIRTGDKIVVHTSGSMPAEVLKKSSSNYGVLYPLQTIIRERKIDASEVPLFITANNETTEAALYKLAKSLNSLVFKIDDDKRVKLHLAAVFASNFSNYLLKISSEILKDENIDFKVLLPLMKETVEKAFDIGPEEAQTGPARRGDCTITDRHKGMIVNKDWRKLYTLFTDLIKKEYSEVKKSANSRRSKL